MLAVLLLVAAAIALIVGLLLLVVAAGIRQEPMNVEMASRAQRPTAALARILLGVHVRRTDLADGTTEKRCPCLAGQGSEGEHR